MKVLVALLLLTNVALFLWDQADFGLAAKDPYQARPAIKPESMQLLTAVSKTTEVNKVVNESSKSAVSSGGGSGEQCKRVGPFTAQSALNKASQQLANLQLNFEAKTVIARQIRAYRVFIGPLKNGKALDQERKMLTQKGIEEFYVIHESDDESSLSLGLFSQQESANKFIADLGKVEIEAESRQEMRTIGERYWIEIPVKNQKSAALKKLQKLDWEEKRVKLRDIDCSEIE